MEYLSLLHLEKEPFSNSPDPDFFFHSHQHLECLQKLELTIRLRQGLSVVLGDVGTGKTTLCRQLIRRLDQGNELTLVRLLLDPEFGSPREFLLALINEFGLEEPPDNVPDRALKETIKQFLIEEGAEKKKIIVLLIDEGQKLPGFSLEIVRELLNFETNRHKLLQTVIFAQKELEEELKNRPNFTDRIATLFILSPFNFTDTKKMIQHRLRLAGKDGNAAASLFTGPAFWVIYRMSKGYPRKIVQLCAKSILSLIIQNKCRVSASLARACAQRMAIRQYSRGRTKHFLWGMSLIAGACVLLWVLSLQRILPENVLIKQMTAPETSHHESPTFLPTGIPPAVKTARGAIADVPSDSPSPEDPLKKYILGTLSIREGETLNILIQRIYGRFSPTLLDNVLRANPQIQNPNRVRAGLPVHFPVIDLPFPFENTAGFLIQLGRFSSLPEMNNFLADLPSRGPDLLPFAIRESEAECSFLIFLNEQFRSQTAAQNRLEDLSPFFRSRSKITENQEVFFKMEKSHDR